MFSSGTGREAHSGGGGGKAAVCCMGRSAGTGEGEEVGLRRPPRRDLRYVHCFPSVWQREHRGAFASHFRCRDRHWTQASETRIKCLVGAKEAIDSGC